MPGPFDDRISGLALSVAADGVTITVSDGNAYLPDAGRMFVASSLSTVATGTLTNSWRHVYLGQNANQQPVIEVSTTAPATPYMGTARTMPGDTTWRYLGSIRFGSDGKAIPFVHTQPGGQGNQIEYLPPNQLLAASLLALNLGNLAAPTVIQLAAFIPTTTRRVRVWVENLSTSLAYIGNPDQGSVSAANNRLALRAGHPGTESAILTSSTQTLQYMMSALLTLGAGLTMRVIGYTFDR